MYFVDVILPVPLEGLFTYGLPEQWAAQVTMGVRVLVPLGKSKHYIAMAVRVHQTEPQVKWKNIEQVLDEVVFLQQGKVILHESVDSIRERTNSSVDHLFREMFRADAWIGGENYAG